MTRSPLAKPPSPVALAGIFAFVTLVSALAAAATPAAAQAAAAQPAAPQASGDAVVVVLVRHAERLDETTVLLGPGNIRCLLPSGSATRTGGYKAAGKSYRKGVDVGRRLTYRDLIADNRRSANAV